VDAVAYRAATSRPKRFRQTGRDDAGNPLHRRIADHPSPCRHCLADATMGDPVLLGSYHFGRSRGVYWTPSPIFVHAEACEPFGRADAVPEIVRNRLVSVRAYDSEDMCLYELGDVCATATTSNGCSTAPLPTGARIA
jgi:hypothetical protein